MIKLNDVKKVYKSGKCSTPAVNGISLTIQDGEWIAIMGTSGSGKSTLLNIIGCMDTLSEGEYYMDDIAVHKVDIQKLHEIRKKKVSFVFQNFALMNQYTVYENVELVLRIRNIPKKKRKTIVMNLLDKLGIAELAGKKPTEISGGQQQRCAIARALASGNSTLVADEPTGALDSKTGIEIMQVFSTLHKEGKTIIMVTHDANIAKWADRTIHIEDGRIDELRA